MADLTPVQILVAVVLGLLPTVRWIVSTPVSTPREAVGFIVVALTGVLFLITQGTNPLTETGFLAYLGASAGGLLLFEAAQKAYGAMAPAPPK